MTESSGGFPDDLSQRDPQEGRAERTLDRQTDDPLATHQTLVSDALPCGDALPDCEFQQCYRLYAGGVRAALRARLMNDLDVDDCLNRVFEKLWSRGRAIPPASRRAWLFVVARNEAALVGRIAARAAGGRPGGAAVVGERLDDDQADGKLGQGGESWWRALEGSPLESLLKQEQIERLRRAAGCLTAEQAEVLRYRFFEDLSFREIAQRLSIPLGTALSRARAAILRLRAEMNATRER